MTVNRQWFVCLHKALAPDTARFSKQPSEKQETMTQTAVQKKDELICHHTLDLRATQVYIVIKNHTQDDIKP